MDPKKLKFPDTYLDFWYYDSDCRHGNFGYLYLYFQSILFWFGIDVLSYIFFLWRILFPKDCISKLDSKWSRCSIMEISSFNNSCITIFPYAQICCILGSRSLALSVILMAVFRLAQYQSLALNTFGEHYVTFYH